MTHHFIERCATCQVVIGQHRCPDHVKKQRWGTCPACSDKVMASNRRNEKPTPCTWTETESHYATACGMTFAVVIGNPGDNEFKWCVYCGREIKAAAKEQYDD